MLGEFNFDLKEILNKKRICDTTIIDNDIIIDRINEPVDDLFNNRYWTEHKPGTKYFTLRLEDRR